MKKILLLCAALVLFAVNASAQKDKPWTEWSQKEAMKMLTDSAWSQSQTEVTETAPPSASAITATQSRNAAGSVSSGEKTESGETIGRKNASLSTIYHVGFLTAKPVRAAIIRIMELQQPETPADKVTERRAFVDKDFGDYIVVTLKLDGSDQNKVRPLNKSLSAANKDTFKDSVYVERKDGKRLSLVDYRVPGPDGMAKFIFPRTFEGKPFLDASSGEVRVYIEIGKTKVNRKFKVADMMYDGKLEY